MRRDVDMTGPKVGDRLGPYELLCIVGRGGFAVVWLARLRGRHGFEKLVAIKTIRPELAPDRSFETMFADEARIAAAIEHPNVARVVDFGEENGVPHLVMEYVAGESLSAIRRASNKREIPLPAEVVVGILADTCSGLHAAHELRAGGSALGVIHRDVSPQNILVTDSGVAKLVDFGIAKAYDRLAADTTHGLQKGKVRYMAPEQVLPDCVIDRRVDIWAIGAVAYEMFEDRPVYNGPNDMARMHALVAGKAVEPLTSDVPPGIAAVVLRALARDPEERFATALALREALLDALAATGQRSSHAAIAQFSEQVLPGRSAERETMLRGAVAEADARVALGPPSSRSASASASASADAGEERDDLLTAQPFVAAGAVARRQTHGSKISMWILVGAFGFALALGWTWWRMGPVPGHEPLPSQAESSPPPGAEQGPAPPAASLDLGSSAADTGAPVVIVHSAGSVRVGPASSRTTRPSRRPIAGPRPNARKAVDDEIQ